MLFRTEINIEPFLQRLEIQDYSLFLGSCFAQHISQAMTERKLNVLANPAGIIFNPISLFSFLEKSLTASQADSDGFLENHEIWYHYDFHSDMAERTREKLEEKIKMAYEETAIFLKKSRFLFLTLGTAWIYELKDTQKIVSNCHKQPARLFEKRLLRIEEIVRAFEKIYPFLPKNLNIVLTLSPVRHLKDTLPLNSLSKAVLRVAAHELTEKYENISYFPAYELLMDDLRDYRFYETDLLHPNSQAVTYIFEKFAQCFFSPALQNFVEKWLQVKKALEHRPFWAESPQHQAFLKDLLAKLESMKEIDVEEEKEKVRKQLIL